MAKGVKTGGRQKGSKNKVTVEREAEIAAAGLTPLEYFLKILRDTNKLHSERASPPRSRLLHIATPSCRPSSRGPSATQGQ